MFIAFLIYITISSAGPASAQTPEPQPWWYTLEQGKLKFRNGDYGNALLSFEDARRQRHAMYEQMERDFISLLSVTEVRRLGDSLDWVERYAHDRFYAAAVAALEELYYRVPKESLGNSAAAALTALGDLKQYPEAEYWIGETYRVEGELGLALSQFQKAYEQRGHFENPGFGLDLLYKIAEILKTRREYTEMVRILRLILEEDKLWSAATGGESPSGEEKSPGENSAIGGGILPGVSPSFAVQAMTRTLENNGIDRFLTMYRYVNTRTVEAHRLLGFYYYLSGRHSRAQEHLMFAFLIQNSVIIEEVIRQQYDFTFTSLETLAAEIQRYPLLSSYVENTEYDKTAYYLGSSLFGNGKAAAARGLWSFLGSQSRAGEWQGRSLGQLRNPRLEPAVEMP